MEEKNSEIVILLFIILVVIIIAMGIVIYRLYNQNITTNVVINELKEKVSNLESTVNNLSVENEEKKEFSEDEMKDAIQNVLDLDTEAFGSPESILIDRFEFYKDDEEFDEDSKRIKIDDIDYRLTNIKYSDFEGKILEYMSENCLENNFHYYKEYKGKLAVKEGGASASKYEVQSIEANKSNGYEVKTIYAGLSELNSNGNIKKGSGKKVSFDVVFKNVNDKCVVDSYTKK